MDRNNLELWLREADPARLTELWARADGVRAAYVGDAVHLRGLIEISNHCVRQCHYCGLRGANHALRRYRMTTEEVMACVSEAVEFGYGTVVLQAGEDYGLTCTAIADLVRRVKAETPLAVTLSLGERRPDELTAWRQAGADRYLLRFETSNPELFARIHPPLPGGPGDRLALLRFVRELGYEMGSGVMVGIPGQSYADLAADLALFAELDLDMIGVGPFLVHPDTPLGQGTSSPALPDGVQVPNAELMTYKAVALSRIVCPNSNIPSTTALATLNRAQGRELGLQRGANVVMPNLTPPHYRCLYEIYPAKACLHETAAQCQGCLQNRITALGRSVGVGRGDSPNRRGRQPVAEPAA